MAYIPGEGVYNDGPYPERPPVPDQDGGAAAAAAPPARPARMASVASLLSRMRTFGTPKECGRCGDPLRPDRVVGRHRLCVPCDEVVRGCDICSLDFGPPGSAAEPAAPAAISPGDRVHVKRAAGEVALCEVCTARRPKGKVGGASHRKKVNVLALDGGGLRGVFTLVILKRLCEVAGKPIHELFDLIVGCSAGGVLACGIGILGMSVDDGVELFLAMATEAFVKRENKASQVATRIGAQVGVEAAPAFSHKYRHRTLEKVLMQHLGHDTRMVSDSPRVALVGLQWNTMPRKPVLFRSYDEPAAATVLGGPQPGTFKVWEAARASAAAPTYFRPFRIGEDWYVDGGLTANNPSIAALNEATALYGMDNINVLVNVGTGYKREGRIDVEPDPWIWNLANEVVVSCIQSQSAIVEATVSGVLGDRFVQLNGPIEHDKMDNADHMDHWVQAATTWCDDPRNLETIELLAARLVSAE
mmetsp:Transcript_29290/g.76784  ORF Transcript_29290/g.76784 Transcript_29290/m.76784 type:complete len:473 (-) Transcript_29290:101-1519(-)